MFRLNLNQLADLECVGSKKANDEITAHLIIRVQTGFEVFVVRFTDYIFQKTFLENVISEADYKYFKSCLKNDDEMFWYFVIRFQPYLVLTELFQSNISELIPRLFEG